MLPLTSTPRGQRRHTLMRKNTITRRSFLARTGAFAAAGIAAPSILSGARPLPSERLGVAFIGAGGRGGANIDGLAPGNDVVALCDVDFRQAGGAFERFRDAKRYKDFRKMFDEVEK